MRKRQEAVRAALLAAVMASKGDGAGTLSTTSRLPATAEIALASKPKAHVGEASVSGLGSSIFPVFYCFFR